MVISPLQCWDTALLRRQCSDSASRETPSPPETSHLAALSAAATPASSPSDRGPCAAPIRPDTDPTMRARRTRKASMAERVSIPSSSLNQWIRIEWRVENGNLGIWVLKRGLRTGETRVSREIGELFLPWETEMENVRRFGKEKQKMIYGHQPTLSLLWFLRWEGFGCSRWFVWSATNFSKKNLIALWILPSLSNPSISVWYVTKLGLIFFPCISWNQGWSSGRAP